MPRYLEWDDVVNRYPRVTDLQDADEIAGTYIIYAEEEVESKLGAYFTVPFSSNNLTAKNLMIDLSYGKMLSFKDSKKSKSIVDMVNSRVSDLISGKQVMMTTGGDVIDIVRDSGWSNTESYTPSFDMNDPENQWTDEDQQEEEYDARL